MITTLRRYAAEIAERVSVTQCRARRRAERRRAFSPAADVEVLEPRVYLSLVVTGAGAGSAPLVRAFDGQTGAFRFEILAYGAAFTGGVHVATGDVNRDGFEDIITAPDEGGGPHIRVFNGLNGGLIGEFFAYDPNFRGGVWIASADVNADGFADIVTGAGPGGGPHVRVFSGFNGVLIGEFFAYFPNFTGGVRVAAGRIGTDAFADIVTAPGPSGGPHIRVFDGFNGFLIDEFMAYDPRFLGGVYVGIGDVNFDGFGDVVTGAGEGGGPHISVFSGFNRQYLYNFFAYPPGVTAGMRVDASDLNNDGFADLIVGLGRSGAPRVRVFSGFNGVLVQDYLAYNAGSGVFVSGIATNNVATFVGSQSPDPFSSATTTEPSALRQGGQFFRAVSGGQSSSETTFRATSGSFDASASGTPAGLLNELDSVFSGKLLMEALL